MLLEKPQGFQKEAEIILVSRTWYYAAGKCPEGQLESREGYWWWPGDDISLECRCFVDIGYREVIVDATVAVKAKNLWVARQSQSCEKLPGNMIKQRQVWRCIEQLNWWVGDFFKVVLMRVSSMRLLNMTASLYDDLTTVVSCQTGKEAAYAL